MQMIIPTKSKYMQRFFKTTPPTAHNVVQLEKKGFIAKEPGQSRSIGLLLAREDLPELEAGSIVITPGGILPLDSVGNALY
jgi:hypothetical protein